MSKRSIEDDSGPVSPVTKRLKTGKLDDLRIVLLGKQEHYSRPIGQRSTEFHYVLLTTSTAIKESGCEDIISNDFTEMSVDGTGGRRIDSDMKKEYENIKRLIDHADTIIRECNYSEKDKTKSNLLFCFVGTQCENGPPPMPWPLPEEEESNE
jgi:hypothetical protein